MGKRKSSDAPTSSSLRWTIPMDKAFLEALDEEIVDGNRVDGQFTSKAYENIMKKLTEKLKYPFTKENLKNRIKTIKSNFNEVYDLFNASGWGWNEATELFETEDEVWESLIEKKPEAKKWKNTPFRNYDLLLKLFSKDRATGNEAETAKEKRLRLNSVVGESSNMTVSNGEGKASDSKDSADSSKAKKRTSDTLFQGELMSIKEGLDNVAQALREGNQVVERGRPQVYTSQEVFEELSRMELEPTFRRKAYRFLNAKHARIRELFGCPIEERKEYLEEMMVEENFIA